MYMLSKQKSHLYDESSHKPLACSNDILLYKGKVCLVTHFLFTYNKYCKSQ